METAEAVVIGSGFGGSIAAHRLAEAGFKPVVLERGISWKITDKHDTFSEYRKPDGRSAWLSEETVVFAPKPIEKFTGILERKICNGITVWCACGVGGGSVVYNSVLLRPSKENFDKTYKKFGATYDDLEKFYDRVVSVMEPETIPDEVLADPNYLSTRVFFENAKLAGIHSERVTVASDWNVVRDEINRKIPESAIAGEIWYGINSGCKKSLDTNYLKHAQEKGAEIRPLHNVTKITENHEAKGFVVHYDEINTKGEVLRQGTIKTKHLFLGAGSMNTSELLVKSKAVGDLPHLNEHVGKFWGNNGDSFATREVGVETNGGRGGPATAVLRHYDNTISPVSVIVYPEWDAPEGTLTTLGMTIVDPIGEFTYADGKVNLNWPAKDPAVANVTSAPDETYRILDGVLDQLSGTKKEADKKHFEGHCSARQEVQAKREPTHASAEVTAHPCGGVVMSKACDHFGRVKGYNGLYVLDGAFIPGCTAACNPAFTIAAFAERSIEHIIAHDFPKKHPK